MNTRQKNAANPLGTQPVGKLLVHYAMPGMLSMIVTALYNIVDQAFIGWGIGYLGNTATTIAFPLTIAGLAVAMLIGSGSAALISLELGRGRAGNAQVISGNAVTLLLAIGLVFMGLMLCFMRPALVMLGATETILPFATDYTTYIMIGMPFALVNTGLSHIIRADGSPRYSMVSTVVGAVLNVILDPIFIFTFGMGVKGAAIATLISQIVSFLFSIVYMLRLAKFTRFQVRCMRINFALVGKAMALGSAGFANLMAITLFNVILNNSLRAYGAASQYGSEIPLAAMGIIMKIQSVVLSCIVGATLGAQPIFGYNYGAGNYGRVRQTYSLLVRFSLALAVVFNILFLVVPGIFIAMFGDTTPEFMEFGRRATAIFLGCIFAYGIQTPSANFFLAIGKPLQSMTLNVMRSVIAMVAVLILPRSFGLDGVLYAGPFGDLLATVIAIVFISRELKELRRKEEL